MGSPSSAPTESQEVSHNSVFSDIATISETTVDNDNSNHDEIKKTQIETNEETIILSWNMQSTAPREIVRIAKHHNADIVSGQETGIPNNEFRELDGYVFWTASGGKEKMGTGKAKPKAKPKSKGRGKGKDSLQKGTLRKGKGKERGRERIPYRKEP